jgi:hypothetical protein
MESANELLSSCEDFLRAYRPSGVGFTLQPESGPAYECWGYINAIQQLSALTDHGRTLTGACPAPATSALQIMEVVVAYLRKHPEELHERAGVEAVYALRQAFPCMSNRAGDFLILVAAVAEINFRGSIWGLHI